MFYHLEVWGCQMNEHDADKAAGLLEAQGYRRTEDPGQADLVVFLTCCVRKKAQDKVYARLGRYRSIKEGRPGMILALGGCLAQQPGETEHLRRRFPWLDLVFGTHNLHRLPLLLQETRRQRGTHAEVWEEDRGLLAPDLPAPREGALRAYIDIIQGCNNFCSYCIVPYVRGRERSRPPGDVEEQVRALLGSGTREITLLGQNVNSYGRDRPGGTGFSGLLARLDALGRYRIRFMTSHPRDFTPELLETICRCRNVCEQFHLPVQAGSDGVLARMNRGYSRGQYLELVRGIRGAVPDPVITSDIIVGFPGESDADFQATLDLVAEASFDQCYTFLYSPRKGTPAADMGDPVPEETKKERFARLLALQDRLSLEKNQAMEGKTWEVLVEGPGQGDPGMLTGRTRGGKIVHFAGPAGMVGRLVPVRITRAATWNLLGEWDGTAYD